MYHPDFGQLVQVTVATAYKCLYYMDVWGLNKSWQYMQLLMVTILPFKILMIFLILLLTAPPSPPPFLQTAMGQAIKKRYHDSSYELQVV